MKTTYKNREVYIEEIEHSSDSVDSYITKAFFVDDQSDLNEDELIALTDEEAMLIYEDWVQYNVGRAEAMYEGER